MKKILFIVLIIMILLPACTKTAPSDGSKALSSAKAEPVSYRSELKAQPIKAADPGFVKGVDSFGFKTASLLYNKENNLAFSPVSIELALAMTSSGAAGDTAKEMKEALGLEDLADEQIAAACKSLMWRANTGGMKAANSLWIDEGYPFSNSFITGCADDYMADVMPLVIPGAMDSINKWAEDKTNGKIDKIISRELDKNTAMVLCNALYFLGDWQLPFEAINTHDDVFTSPAGKVTASFMYRKWPFPYYQSDRFSMISLNFKSKDGEGKYAMAFILPKEGEDLSDIISSLDPAGFSNALSGLKKQEVIIKLPKFKFMYGTSLKDTLISLGMKSAFTGADFSGMTGGENSGLYISDVLHNCYIRVDELGAEAAAVTGEVAPGAAPSMNKPAEFYADRPFLFAIYSTEDGTIDFLGAINDPSKQ